MVQNDELNTPESSFGPGSEPFSGCLAVTFIWWNRKLIFEEAIGRFGYKKNGSRAPKAGVKGRYSSSHNHGSGKWGPGRCVACPTVLFSTSMIMGGRVIHLPFWSFLEYLRTWNCVRPRIPQCREYQPGGTQTKMTI